MEADAPRAVLWDLDGTLVDSRHYHWRAWRDTLAAESVTLTEADFDASFGRRNAEFLGDWLGPDTAPDRVRRVADAKEALYRERVEREGIEGLPGGADWIRRLHAGGWRQAVASSAPRRNVTVVLSALGIAPLIEAALGSEDVERGKPSPDVFLLAAERLGVAPSRCLVVEDVAAGVEAARLARMRVIGVGGEATAAADVVVESLDDLPVDAFDRLLNGEVA